eukprot:jgi/Bigna1/69888/fgenesh1_pg.10_\
MYLEDTGLAKIMETGVMSGHPVCEFQERACNLNIETTHVATPNASDVVAYTVKLMSMKGLVHDNEHVLKVDNGIAEYYTGKKKNGYNKTLRQVEDGKVTLTEFVYNEVMSRMGGMNSRVNPEDVVKKYLTKLRNAGITLKRNLTSFSTKNLTFDCLTLSLRMRSHRGYFDRLQKGTVGTPYDTSVRSEKELWKNFWDLDIFVPNGEHTKVLYDDNFFIKINRDQLGNKAKRGTWFQNEYFPDPTDVKYEDSYLHNEEASRSTYNPSLTMYHIIAKTVYAGLVKTKYMENVGVYFWRVGDAGTGKSTYLQMMKHILSGTGPEQVMSMSSHDGETASNFSFARIAKHNGGYYRAVHCEEAQNIKLNVRQIVFASMSNAPITTAGKHQQATEQRLNIAWEFNSNATVATVMNQGSIAANCRRVQLFEHNAKNMQKKDESNMTTWINNKVLHSLMAIAISYTSCMFVMEGKNFLKDTLQQMSESEKFKHLSKKTKMFAFVESGYFVKKEHGLVPYSVFKKAYDHFKYPPVKGNVYQLYNEKQDSGKVLEKIWGIKVLNVLNVPKECKGVQKSRGRSLKGVFLPVFNDCAYKEPSEFYRSNRPVYNSTGSAETKLRGSDTDITDRYIIGVEASPDALKNYHGLNFTNYNKKLSLCDAMVQKNESEVTYSLVELQQLNDDAAFDNINGDVLDETEKDRLRTVLHLINASTAMKEKRQKMEEKIQTMEQKVPTKFHQRKFCGWPLWVLRKKGLLDKMLTETEEGSKKFKPVTRNVGRGLQHQEKVVLDWLETYMNIDSSNGKARFSFNKDKATTAKFNDIISHINNITCVLVSRFHDRLHYDKRICDNDENKAHFEELLDKTSKYYQLIEKTCSKRNMERQ